MDRKDFFSEGIKDVIREISQTPVGSIIDRQLQSISNILAPDWLDQSGFASEAAHPTIQENLPRPPGAVQNPDLFNEKCTVCGACVVACPHGTLFQIPDVRGPVLDPNLRACRLCHDYPCIASCETGALKKLKKNHLPWFGNAFVNDEKCHNHAAKRQQNNAKGTPFCKICQMGCPVKGTISFSGKKFPVFGDTCTGCGMCALVCPADAIEIDLSGE